MQCAVKMDWMRNPEWTLCSHQSGSEPVSPECLSFLMRGQEAGAGKQTLLCPARDVQPLPHGATSSRSEVLMAQGLQGGQMANNWCTIHADMQRLAKSANAETRCPAEFTRPSACEWKWTGCMQIQQKEAQITDDDLIAGPTLEKSLAFFPSTTSASEISELHEAHWPRQIGFLDGLV